ncbi:hypothetical protein K488DRAFT_73422 [Vararia minispora EC-137]|uniref:Uncharacterized protein n=1 Tax=Vararia minispora EC-137 TaxID=1314806 RepID=A0ACB8QAP0_9AGAM|nr:hypothetical protein K488DRAFT_73422 [Vararia minispora EC-137]
MGSSIDMSTLFSLTSRTALITGGGSGIGSYIAHAFAQVGCTRVYITGRRLSALAQTAAAYPEVIVPIQGDVSTKEGSLAIAKAFEEAEHARLGGGEGTRVVLDVLVNNAGISRGDGFWEAGACAEAVSAALLQASDEDWAQTFAINVSAIQWMSAALLPYLVHSGAQSPGRASIINNTSVAALTARLPAHVYATSKAAAESLTQNLANKLTPLGVRVNSIAFGPLPSEMDNPQNPNSIISRAAGRVPVGRVGNEEDAAGAAVYLASRAGGFVTGACLKVGQRDGGGSWESAITVCSELLESLLHVAEMEGLPGNIRLAIIDECNKGDGRDDGMVTCDLGAIAYKVKYGATESLKTRIMTQPFLHEKAGLEPAKRMRIPKIIDRFEDEGEDGTKQTYVVMDLIKFVTVPLEEMEARVEAALGWLSSVQAPDKHELGPLGGAQIRHRLFNEGEAPKLFVTVKELESYLNKALRRTVNFGGSHQKVDLKKELRIFTQGDVDDSHFGVDEQGLTVIMGFDSISFLPQSFGAYALDQSDSFAHLLGRFQWPTSNLDSMVEIGILLGMTAPSSLELIDKKKAKKASSSRREGGRS